MHADYSENSFLLKNLMKNTTDMIYFKDLQSRFIMMNEAAAHWQGFNHPDDAIGTSDFDKYTKEDAQRMFEDEQRIIKTGEPLRGIEEEETWQDGQIRWVSTTKMPLRDSNGNIVGTFGVSRDITEHKEAEIRAAYYAEQAQSIKEQMEEDVRMAAELQKTFFPQFYPPFPKNVSLVESAVQFHHHYVPSGTVSGDLCSIHKLSETKCGILLSDVMGHGVRAALGTALITAVAADFSQKEHDPSEFLSRMNEVLLPILRQEDSFLYATACYIVFDTSTGMLRYANAGHPIPILFSDQGKKASWLMDEEALRGPALAICEEATYQTYERLITPGDSVIMYTDGLYETTNPDSEEFGEERLLEAAQKHASLPLYYLFSALINEAHLFANNGIFDDDLCLIGFKFRHLTPAP